MKNAVAEWAPEVLDPNRIFPAEPFPLLPTGNEIHLYSLDLDEFAGDIEYFWNCLSAAEQARALRFIFERDRRRHIFLKAQVRKILAGYLGVDPDQVAFTVGASGKPGLMAGANGADVRFNVSHSGNRALLAVGVGGEIGVDLQELSPEPSWRAVAKRCFTRDEQKALEGQPPDSASRIFAEIWTRKEALGKALGEGLTPRILAAAVGPANWGTVDAGDGWEVRSLAVGGSFAAALAAKRQPSGL